MGNESDEYIETVFDLIDRQLANQAVSVNQRPLKASILFVTDWIVEVAGEEKENFKTDFCEKQWFKGIYKKIYSWYCLRYGEAFNITTSSSSTITGVIIFYGTPFEVSIPLSVTGNIEIPGEQVWFTIPNSILPDEDVVDWLENPPSLDALNQTLIKQLYHDLSYVGTSMRSIHVNLMTAEMKDEQIRGMARGIKSHLINAARDILQLDTNGVTYAYWELHLAVEKSIKVFLIQHGTTNPRNHDLLQLFELAEKEHGLEVNKESIGALPTGKEAIQYRYAELPGTTTDYAVRIYNAVLDLVTTTTHALQRKITMDNASFLIQRPPWDRD